MATSSNKPLLVELHTEEMPPLLLDNVANGFADNLVRALAEVRVCDPDSESQNWSTPRRIAVLIQGVVSKSPVATGLRRGPSRENAYDKANKPTPALTGFLLSCGARKSDLQEVEYKGQPYVAVPYNAGGEPLGGLLGSAIERAVLRTVAPRLMRWESTNKYRFVRPINSVSAVHGKRPVVSTAFGETTLRHSFGHHFLMPDKIRITDAAAYPEIIRKHQVMVNASERREDICKQARKLSPQVRIDEKLLFEIANMCEQPLCYSAKFDAKYQVLPDKIIETCMGKHLRSFAVGATKLKNEFIFVADNRPVDGNLLRAGLARVMRARLDDTLFIYEVDSKVKPEELLQRLANISYLKGMGSMHDRCERVGQLAQICANDLKLSRGNKKILSEAAKYIKADLGTLLVDEYPSLEGHIGAALLAKAMLPNEVCELIGGHLERDLDKQHNRIRDALVLALEVERVVSIAAAFGLPKGSGDPQGLRRSMGRVVLILQRHPHIDFNSLLRIAWEICLTAAAKHGALEAGFFAADRQGFLDQIKRFALERLCNMADTLVKPEVTRRTLNAVSAVLLHNSPEESLPSIADILNRIDSLEGFIADRPHRQEYDNLLASAKRLDNISNQQIRFFQPMFNDAFLNKDLNKHLDGFDSFYKNFSDELAHPLESMFAVIEVLNNETADWAKDLPASSAPIDAPHTEQIIRTCSSITKFPCERLAGHLDKLSLTMTNLLESGPAIHILQERLAQGAYLSQKFAEDVGGVVLPTGRRLTNSSSKLLARTHETKRQWGAIFQQINRFLAHVNPIANALQQFEKILKLIQGWEEKSENLRTLPFDYRGPVEPNELEKAREHWNNALRIRAPLTSARDHIIKSIDLMRASMKRMERLTGIFPDKQGRTTKDGDVLPAAQVLLLKNIEYLDCIAGQIEFGEVKEELLIDDEERRLFAACKKIEKEAWALLEKGDYANYYPLITSLTKEIDAFLDAVKVDVKDFRKNRLNLVGMAARLLNATFDTRKMYA